MTTWNPNGTATSGLEWYPTRKLTKSLSSASLLGVKVVAGASETIASIHARLASEGAAPFGVDVYDLANPLFDYVRPVLSLPVANRENAAGWKKYISGVESAYDANAFACIDDIVSLNFPLSVSASDSILYLGALNDNGHAMFNTTWADGFVDANTGDPGYVVDSLRCTSVDIVIVAENVASFGAVRFDSQISIAGTRYGSQSGSVLMPAGTGLTRYVFRYPRNPSTGQQWTQDDIDDIVLQTDGIGVRILSKTQAGYFLVTAINPQFKVCTERRVTSGYGFTPATGGAWSAVNCENPASGAAANWSKTAGHTYLYLFYLINGNATLVGVDSANLPNHAADELTGWQGAIASAENFAPTDTPVYSPWVPAMFLKQASTAISVDSQPYVTPGLLPVYAGVNDRYQTMAAHASLDYGSVAVVVSRQGTPTDNLAVKIRASSGDAQVGGTGTITAADVPADGLPHLVRVKLASNASLNAGSSYYIKFTSSTSVDAMWIVHAVYTGAETLSPDADDQFAANASISGDALGHSNLDMLVNAATAPTAPGSISAGLGTFTPTASPPGGPDTVRYAAIDWASTALGGDFAYYELQRQDAGTWRSIALVTTEASSYFNDFEAPRSVVSNYQVRSVRNDGAVSNYRTGASTTVPSSGGDCDVILTTNAEPELTLAYQDAAPHTYTRANAGQYATQVIAGRQAPMAFRSIIEGNADVFSRTFLIAMDEVTAPLTTIDRSVFDPIIALIEANAPYIVVMQGNGDRWYASGKIASATFSQPGNVHKVQVDFTEVAFTPAAIVVGTPWAP